MARKEIAPEIRERILADWRTGEFSTRDLARKHEVSLGYIGKIIKNIPKDLADVVNAGIKYRSAVLSENEHVANALTEVVDEKTKHQDFFNNATVKNISLLMDKIGPNTGIDDHKSVQYTIAKGKETVLGKSSDNPPPITNRITFKINTPHDLSKPVVDIDE